MIETIGIGIVSKFEGYAGGWGGMSQSPIQGPRKVTWKKASLYRRIIGWSGFLLCENFSPQEYKDMFEWCKETYDDNVKIQYGLGHLTEKHKLYTIPTWLKSNSWPDNTVLLKIHFKKKEDAVTFKIAWAGEE